MDEKTDHAIAAARKFLDATAADTDENAVIAMSIAEAGRDHRRIMRLGDVRVLFALAGQAEQPADAYRLTAVTEDGFGTTFSWGDTYEVQAASYEEARADVLGRESSDGKKPYARITSAWRRNGNSPWQKIEIKD